MSRINFFDLTNWTNEELIEYGRAGRSLLQKREKRLAEATAKHPGRYSTHGLNTLQDKKDGIPMVSTKMGRNTLKANVMRIEELKHMKTTTARGAKRHQGEQIRLMLNLPIDGRLKAQEQRDFDQARQYIEQDSDFMSKYWKAFDYYQSEIMNRNYSDSYQELEEFRRNLSSDLLLGGGITRSLDDIKREIDRIIAEEDRHEQNRSQLKKIGREGGFI